MNSFSFKTKIGWLTIKSNKSKIFFVKFGKLKNKGNTKYLTKVVRQLKLYAFGKLKNFKINYALIGTPLQIKIWQELAKIKYGQIQTYGQIAKKLNTSPRYVGNVCGQNNLLLIIPCHRVIRSDGKIGGFSGLGGINLKKKLLKIENNA